MQYLYTILFYYSVLSIKKYVSIVIIIVILYLYSFSFKICFFVWWINRPNFEYLEKVFLRLIRFLFCIMFVLQRQKKRE